MIVCESPTAQHSSTPLPGGSGPLGGGSVPLVTSGRSRGVLVGSGGLTLLLAGGSGLSLEVAVEVEIGHDGPLLGARQGAAEAEHLTGEQPPDETNRAHRVVVAGDGNVDIAAARSARRCE